VKGRSICVRLHGATSQNTAIFMLRILGAEYNTVQYSTEMLSLEFLIVTYGASKLIHCVRGASGLSPLLQANALMWTHLTVCTQH
jgi:hypothetical protein